MRGLCVGADMVILCFSDPEVFTRTQNFKHKYFVIAFKEKEESLHKLNERVKQAALKAKEVRRT